MRSAGRSSVDSGQPKEAGSTTRFTISKPPLAPVSNPPPLTTTFSLDDFLGNFSGVSTTATGDLSEEPQQRSTSKQRDCSTYAPFAAQEGSSGIFDFFFAAASGTPGANNPSGNSNNTGIGNGRGEDANDTNAVSAAPLAADSNNNDSATGGRLSFDFASFFLQSGQNGAYDDNGRDAAGCDGGRDAADARGLEHYIQRGSGNAAESAGTGVSPTMGFLFPVEPVTSTTTDGTFAQPPTTWGVESTSGTDNRYAPPQLQSQDPEAASETVVGPTGNAVTHTAAQSDAALTIRKCDSTHIIPVDQTPAKRPLCQHASSSAIDHDRSLAVALAAAPSPFGPLSDEESQRTATPLSRSCAPEDATWNETSTRLAADKPHPDPEALDNSSAQVVAERDTIPAPTYSRQLPPHSPLSSLPRASHLPGAAPADAVITRTPPSPRKLLPPVTPPTSAPYCPEASMPIVTTGSDGTSVALRKAIGEAEEVWAHGIDMESITCPDGRNAGKDMSSSCPTPSASSDAVFFAEVAQLHQQTARLTEESARSAASLQTLTTDLLRILGPHAALSSLAGEQYVGTPLVHLPWALVEVLEGLLHNETDAKEKAEEQPVAPRLSSDGAEIGSSGDHGAEHAPPPNEESLPPTMEQQGVLSCCPRL